MTTKQKEQIKTLRIHNYSYGEIASLLNLPKSTIASFCQKERTKLETIPADNAASSCTKPATSTKPDYHICKECGELFIAKTKRYQEFCSSKCRVAFWRKKQSIEEFKKALDFLDQTSDRWCMGDSSLIVGICRLEESTPEELNLKE